MKPLFCLMLAGLFAAGAAHAQGLQSTTPATQSRSTTRVEPVRSPAPPQRQPVPAPPPRPLVPPIPSSPDQRPQPPVPVHGASRTQDAGKAAGTVPAPAPPAKVYDRNGRLIPGMRPAGANRVLDTRTGRYYDTVPSGDGQRIVR
ncbi:MULTISPECIES: hypothetical protein [Gammaproteobacteria]|jgi:hypothetical protein|uniref:Classical arabinogalactan protein 4 n=1 Tax=Xanthomonas boreopolis TaxID=86183 RepID=A0A919FD13_9XANT|nr:hypothetical protein [Pseudomonas sp. Hp2]GHH60894.1 hypothetical protein GCM10009090_36820 [[Pseudomonas] boreopolis]